MAHLFVYGTLKRGRANHRVLVELGARFVAEARTLARRTLVDLGPYPALLDVDPERDAAACPVVGEVFALDDGALGAVDEFEGAPDLYRRDVVEVQLEGAPARRMTASTYVLVQRAPERPRVLRSGTYESLGEWLDEGVTREQLDDARS